MGLKEELTQFLDQLKKYRDVLKNPDSMLLEDKDSYFAAFPFLQKYLPGKSQEELREALREHLVRESGAFKARIAELTRKQYYSQFGQTREMWSTALGASVYPADRLTAVGLCIDATNEAIGIIESDIRKGVRDERGQLVAKPESSSEPPKAFIAHGGRSGVLDKLREYVHALGIDPLVVELLTSQGMSVDDKVNKYIKDADCGIVLATKGGIVDTTSKTPRRHSRLNVIDEYERLRAAFPHRTVLLVENGVDLPSNISGITYERFARQSMDRAFTAVARELTAFGILKAVKPSPKEHA